MGARRFRFFVKLRIVTTDTRTIVSVTAFGQNVSTYVRSAGDGEPKVIMRNNRPAAVLTGVEDAERLSRID